MSDRTPSLGEGPSACPLVGLEDDRHRHSPVPARRHRCYAEDPPAPRALAHQQAYCLTSDHPVCPFYQDWIARQGRQAQTGTAVAAGLAAVGRPPDSDDVAAGRSSSRDDGGAGRPRTDDASQVPAFYGYTDQPRGADPAASIPPAGPANHSAHGSGTFSERGAAYSREAAGGYGDPRPTAVPDASEAEIPPFLAGRAASQGPSPSPADTPHTRVVSAASADAPRRSPDSLPQQPSSPPGDPGVAAPTARPGVVSRVDRKAPAWERPRRFEAYPSLQARMRMRQIPRLPLAIGALVLAALVIFTLPGLFAGAGDRASPTPTRDGAGRSRSPDASSGEESTPRPGRSSAPASADPSAPGSGGNGGGGAQTYTVVAGDTLAAIAERFNVSVERILDANPQITNPNLIEVGDEIRIPRRRASPSP
ncbi:MAG: LysM peptidoglycan-binding domain-containing protein [Candidatus Limnocylindrales bacterium]